MTDPPTQTAVEKPPLTLNREQVACLASPVKREILEAMLRLRAASIPELTAYMGRSPKSLYYHVHQLCQVSLLVVREMRQMGKRSEAVYEAVADRMVMEEENEDAEFRQTAYRAQRALLRKLARELMPSENGAEAGETDEADVLRVLVWLKPEARRQLQAMLEEITHFLRENDDPQQGKRTALTVFVTTQKKST